MMSLRDLTDAQLLRRFDFSLVDPTMPVKSYSAGIHIQSDLMVRVVRRAD